MVQSLLAVGRDCQCGLSTHGIRRPHIVCCYVWRSHRRISCLALLKQWSLDICRLDHRFLRVFDLPVFWNTPEYLSRSFAEHCDNVVLRNFLWGMSETEETVFVAGAD